MQTEPKKYFRKFNFSSHFLVSAKLISFAGNLARGKPTAQSSQYSDGASSRAVDGGKNTNWGGRSCTHTQRQMYPWWRVDLRRIYTVGKVQLTNRGDAAWTRLRNFEIRVGNTDRTPKANRMYVVTFLFHSSVPRTFFLLLM